MSIISGTQGISKAIVDILNCIIGHETVRLDVIEVALMNHRRQVEVAVVVILHAGYVADTLVVNGQGVHVVGRIIIELRAIGSPNGLAVLGSQQVKFTDRIEVCRDCHRGIRHREVVFTILTRIQLGNLASDIVGHGNSAHEIARCFYNSDIH